MCPTPTAASLHFDWLPFWVSILTIKQQVTFLLHVEIVLSLGTALTVTSKVDEGLGYGANIVADVLQSASVRDTARLTLTLYDQCKINHVKRR